MRTRDLHGIAVPVLGSATLPCDHAIVPGVDRKRRHGERPRYPLRLDAMPDGSRDKPIFLRADRSVPYGEMMGVLEILRAGGYTKVKLVALERAPGQPAPADAASP